jgi:hypothetical protein
MGGRSTVELMVLALTATICVMLLLTGGTIAVIEILDPTVDTSGAVSTLTDLLSMILGALLGLLAGRSERSEGLHQRPGTHADDGL